MKKNIQNQKMKEAVDLLLSGEEDLSNILAKDGLIKQLTKALLERALNAEMNDHLGYERYDRSESEDARNGNYNKSLMTEQGNNRIKYSSR